MRLNFVPIHVFRKTPAVTCFDAGFSGSNGTDVVVHHSAATSPPDIDGSEQYYVHQHQVDHDLVLTGERVFTLLNPSREQPHHVIHLACAMGALQIPIGTFHRSVSGEDGSLVLNPISIRDPNFNYASEFIPVKLSDRHDLIKAKSSSPWVGTWRDVHIYRHHSISS